MSPFLLERSMILQKKYRCSVLTIVATRHGPVTAAADTL
mgnify:CR=1 FL=1